MERGIIERRVIIRKKSLFLITLIIMLFGLLDVKAEDKYYLTKETYDNIYYVQNGLPDFYGSDIQFKFSINEKNAFCMDPNYSIKSYEYFGIPLTEVNYSNDTIEYINKIIYYGYDYPGHQTERYYIATQALIWEQTSTYKIEFYTERYGYGDYIDVSKEKEEIKNLIEQHDDIPYFSNQIFNYEPTNFIEFEDDILNEFILIGTNWNDVILESNKLKINNLENYSGIVEIYLKKRVYRHDTAMYYYSDGSQPIVTGGSPSEVIVKLTININGGKIRVNKLDSESKLPIKDTNIKFNIINLDTGEYATINDSTDLNINEDGYLLTNLLPYGEYKITEISTVDGYELSNLSFRIDLNENTEYDKNGIYNFNFFNDKQKGTIEILKIDSQTKNIIQNVEFGLFAKEDIITKDGVFHYKKDQLVTQKYTNEDGIVTFDNLILGKYYIKELNPLNGYKDNNKIYNFNLYDVKNNKITIENEMEIGTINLKKNGELYHYDTGQYSSKFLENIEFSLYAEEDIITPNGILKYKKGDLVSRGLTDINGTLNFDNLIFGKYYLIETKTNENYVIDLNKYYFNLYENQNPTIEITNHLKKANLKINKLDSESKLPIKDVNIKFNIKNIDDNSYIYINGRKDLSINEFGYLLIESLPFGKYEIKEIQTNYKYNLTEDIKIIEINDNTLNSSNILEVNFYNKLKKGSIKVIKYGETYDFKNGKYNNKLLHNIEFELFSKEDIIMPDGTKYYSKNEKITSKKTNSKGVINFENLLLGEYCIKEKTTEEKYIIDTNEYCFDLKKIENQEIEIMNYLKKFDLKINKLDIESKLPIKSSNIKFSIKNLDSNRYIYINDSKELQTNSEGIIYIENLPYGNYEIKELETLSDYDLNDESIKIEINGDIKLVDNILEINIYNQLKKGSIGINKVDSLSKLGINNVGFSLYAKDDIVTIDGITHYKKDQLILTELTNKEGRLIFDNLILGDYYIKETSTPIEYVKNDNIYDFNLKEKIDNKITIENELKKGSIKLTKYGETYDFKTREYTNKLLSNIEFDLFAKEDIIMPDGTKYYLKNEIITSKKTNSKGTINFDNLILGEYCIKEKNTEEKYIIDTQEYCFDLKEIDNREIEIVNYLKKFNLKINKVDSESNLLIKSSNIKFSIKNLDSNRYIYINDSKELQTNSEGIIYIEKLPHGNYEIKELETLPNYILNKEAIKIEIDDNTKLVDNILDVNIYNQLKKGSIKITKYGEIFDFNNLKYNTKELSDVEFNLYAGSTIINQIGEIIYQKDQLILSGKTDQSGIIEFNNLYLGNYYIREKTTNKDYIIDENKYYFDLNEKQYQEIELINYLKKNNLTIIKQDSETKETIKGVIFEIFYNNISLGKYTTDKNGKINLKKLPETTYIIKELEAKKGYILNEEEISLNLKDNQEIIIENSKKIELPNTIKNDYIKTAFNFILIFGLSLLIYDKKIIRQN